MRTFPQTFAALTLTTSLLASACALEEGDELDAEIGETESEILDYDEDFAGSGLKEIPVSETEGVEAVVQGYSGSTIYGIGGTVISGQPRLAARILRDDGSYTSRNVVPDGHSLAWGRAAVNVGFPNDAIMAVGTAGTSSDRKLMVAFMTSAGLDGNYGGGDGMSVFNVSTTEPYEEGTAMAVDPAAGRVYVGGNACHSDSSYGLVCRPFIVRFTLAGAWDSNYGVKYFSLPTVPFYSEELKGLAVDADGGVIVATQQQRSYSSSDVVVRRITPTALDSSFAGGAGNQRFGYATVEGLAIDPATDRIVLAGNDQDGTRTYVWQLTYAGVRVPGFGGTFNAGNGFAIIDYTSRASEQLGDLKIDEHGRIILLGGGATPAVASFTVVRLLANGQPDTSFEGDDGKDFITFPASPDGSVGMSLFVDGLTDTIVAAGLGLSDDTEKMVFARVANP